MNDTLLKMIIILLTIATLFTILGFAIGYNTPQMQGIFNQINATQDYAVNMTNAFSNANNYFSQTNTGFLAPIENVLSFAGNLLYKIGILLYNFFLIVYSVFTIAFTTIFIIIPSIFNTTNLGALSNIATLIYGATIGILTIIIVIYIINFIRGRNNV